MIIAMVMGIIVFIFLSLLLPLIVRIIEISKLGDWYDKYLDWIFKTFK